MARRVRFKLKWLQNVLLAAAVATISVFVWPSDRLGVPALSVLASPLQFLETFGYDTLFLMRGSKPHAVNPDIVIVSFDSDTELTLKQTWPPSRSVHAQVIRNLKAAGAKLICYDVLFKGNTTIRADKDLDDALKAAGNVVLTCRLDRDSSRQSVRIESPYYDDELAIDYEAKAMIGFAEVQQDLDSVVRLAVPTMKFMDEWFPSFAAAAALKLQGLDESAIKVTETDIELGKYKLPRTGPTSLDPFEKGGFIPSAYIDYSGGSPFPSELQFQQVFANDSAIHSVKGKIVFVGLTGIDLIKQYNERYTTSYTRMTPARQGSLTFSEIPGVVVQAHMLNTILGSHTIRLAPIWSAWMGVFAFALAGSTLVRRNANWRGPVLLLICLIAYAAVAGVLFAQQALHIPWLTPILLVLTTSSLIAWFERGAMRKKWSGYVSPAVLETILKNDEDVFAERYEATVMFGDIRGFTSFSDKHEPEKVVRILNKHFEKLTEIIYAEDGAIDKFLGDGILCVFGAPIADSQSAAKAVRAALKMRELSMVAVEDDGEDHVMATGFGITTGPFVAGHIGSRQRHDFSIIGDVVNVAARLQGVTGEPDVIIDAETYERIKPHVQVESLGEVVLKGKPLPVACYKVLEWVDEPFVPASEPA